MSLTSLRHSEPRLTRARTTLLLLAISIFLVATLPRLLGHGMFFDGVTYASIARNLAAGDGSFWKTHYTDVVYPEFYEHPPLAFWIQSISYRLFGESMAVEAVHGLALGLATLLTTALVWSLVRQAGEGGKSLGGAWLPIVFFSSIPLVSWVFANNMLENTMAVFVVTSVAAGVAGCRAPSVRGAMVWGGLAGLTLVAAFLCKGPVGLFPLVTPVAAALLLRTPFRQSSAALAGIIVVVLVAVAIFWAGEESRHFFSSYFRTQIAGSVSGVRATDNGRFDLFRLIVQEVSVPLGVGLLLLVATRRRPVWRRPVFFFLAIALCGSLPIALSLKQYRWYLVPSFPFWAMAIAAAASPAAVCIERAVGNRQAVARSIGVLAGVITLVGVITMITGRDTVRRYHDLHRDFRLQPVSVERGTHISIPPGTLSGEWHTVALWARWHNASLTEEPGADYFLAKKNEVHLVPEGYRPYHPRESHGWVLYRKE